MGFDDKLVRKKLEVLLKDQVLVERYLRIYGPKLDMSNVAKLKAFQAAATNGGPEGDNGEPTYHIKLKCPICNQADIICHEMKAKCMTLAFDRFLVPRYKPVKPFTALNYSLVAVTVCPSCLFASPDKKDFLTFSVQAGSENKSQLSPYVLDELRKRVEARKSIIAGVSDFAEYFKVPRSQAASINAYKLAIHRAQVEATLETPLAWYKAGMYSLKIALLTRDSGKDDEPMLKEAADALAKSFRASELKVKELEYQLVYTLATLYLRLGEQAQCQAFMGVLDKWHGEQDKESKIDPRVTTVAVDKWIDKVKDMWTDRDDPDLWKH